MNENKDKLNSLVLKMIPLLVAIICLIKIKMNDEVDVVILLRESLSIAIPISFGAGVLIDKIIWKWALSKNKTNLFYKLFSWLFPCPVLKDEYKGIIHYEYPPGVKGQKPTNIYISQSLSDISIRTETNEITSNTITSEIINEFGVYVLYYTYCTNPSMTYSEKNPRQYGTCRIEIPDNGCLNETENLKAIYWTTSKTKGDIVLYKEKASNRRSLHNK